MKTKPITTSGDVAYVPLTKGFVAVIDASDVPLVAGSNWWALQKANGVVYAVRQMRILGKKQNVLMHRVIAGTPNGLLTDHIDGDGLNNRRSNLRHATNEQNQRNRGANRGTRSGLKGVQFHKRDRLWLARITVNKKVYSLGYFKEPEQAHNAYCEAVNQMHGEFGRDS